MVKTPRYLKKGDTIGMVCPAGYMDYDKAQCCIDTLQRWGYKVKVGSTLGSGSLSYFSGSDEERLLDLQSMLDDDSVDAILFGRGGYGVTRIIDRIDFNRFVKNPKWLIGFSDITLLHSHVYANFRIATMHAPMAAAFNNAGESDKYILSLKKALEGKTISYSVSPHPFNRKGEVIGELVGGNLALLAHAVGTASDIKTKGKILFMEDVGEYLYNIDRMLHQLKRAGKFDRLGGLIVGGFTDNKDTERPFGATAEMIIRNVVDEYDFPVCFNFPVSHGKDNYALKVGEGYKLKVGKSRVTLSE